MDEDGHNHFEWDNPDQEKQKTYVFSYMGLLALNLQMCEYWNLENP